LLLIVLVHLAEYIIVTAEVAIKKIISVQGNFCTWNLNSSIIRAFSGCLGTKRR
jgi:hypothetical protein